MHVSTNIGEGGCDRRLADLYEALADLRASGGSGDTINERHWRVVERYVRETCPRAFGDDLRQEVLLTIFLSIRTMRARRPRAAAAWVRSIRRSKVADAACARGTVRHVPLHGRLRPFELAAPAPSGLDLVEAILTAFEAEVRRELSSDPIRERRRRKFLQARAALRRIVLEEPLVTIASHLDAQVSPELLAKWIERGRAVIVATIARLRATEPDAAELYLVVDELARTRRADAGMPRPNRRRLHPPPA